MRYARTQASRIRELLRPGKVLILYGARQVGKTTLVRELAEKLGEPYTYVTGEDLYVRDYLGSRSVSKLQEFVGQRRLLVVDEAQYIPEIALNLKMIVDSMPDVRVLATGSSSLRLARDIGEPLTGRAMTLQLYPLSQAEIAASEDRHETDARLESRLIYGTYPEVVTTPDNELRALYLRELVRFQLLRDILELDGIRRSDKLLRLLQLLAHQVGSEVSASTLGSAVGVSKNTVERYLDLLAKAFILYRVSGFSRILRKEIIRNSKFYFVDNGIRNALINNFSPLSLRQDIGQLWENYIFTERLKRNDYHFPGTNMYFWRTYEQQEIDIIEERDGKLAAFELKWAKTKTKPPTAWAAAYPDTQFAVINRDNYLTYITDKESKSECGSRNAEPQ